MNNRIDNFLSNVYTEAGTVQDRRSLANLEWIPKQIKTLNKSQLMYIFSIIDKHKVEYTQMEEGIYFDACKMDDVSYNEMFDYLLKINEHDNK